MQIDAQEATALGENEAIVRIERLEHIFNVDGRPKVIGQVLGRCPDIDTHRQRHRLAESNPFQFVDFADAQKTAGFEELFEGDQIAGFVERAQAYGFNSTDIGENVHEGDEAEECVEEASLCGKGLNL